MVRFHSYNREFENSFFLTLLIQKASFPPPTGIRTQQKYSESTFCHSPSRGRIPASPPAQPLPPAQSPAVPERLRPREPPVRPPRSPPHTSAGGAAFRLGIALRERLPRWCRAPQRRVVLQFPRVPEPPRAVANMRQGRDATATQRPPLATVWA